MSTGILVILLWTPSNAVASPCLDALDESISPLTGERYTPAEVTRVRKLHQVLPSNPLVPCTQAFADRAASRPLVHAAMQKLVLGTAQEADVARVYDHYDADAKARCELARHVLESGPGDLTAAKYTRVAQQVDADRARIAAARAQSRALLGLEPTTVLAVAPCLSP